jgi:hypothetical protein
MSAQKLTAEQWLRAQAANGRIGPESAEQFERAGTRCEERQAAGGVMSEPSGVSLRKLGLQARDSLTCPRGGLHNVLEPHVIMAAAQGGGIVFCMKCGDDVVLEPLRPKED